MTPTDFGMVALGHGKYVRASEIAALVPIDDDRRGDGRRTFVHVAGLDAPLVASRSERAILADMASVPAGGSLPLAGAEGRGGSGRRWRRRGIGHA